MNPFFSTARLAAASGFLLFSLLLKATTIIPFANLGDMAQASAAVVVARAEANFDLQQGGVTSHRTRFTVLESVKGQLAAGAAFELQAWRQRVGGGELLIAGDAEFAEGGTYLLFLNQRASEPHWQPMMLAYGIFEQHPWEDGDVFVPSPQSLEIEAVPRPDGVVPEPMAVYLAQPLVDKLRKAVKGGGSWESRSATAGVEPAAFYLEGRAAPSHCTFLGSPSARFTSFPSDDIEVYSEDDGDAGFSPPSAVVTQLTGAIADMEASYGGISLTYVSTLNFTPDCSDGTALGGDFLALITPRKGLVMYNDPCSQITDLSGCSGTLAIGGLYTSGTHTYDGSTWSSGYCSYVIVNNGTGSCLSAANYKIMLTHELSHTLGTGHIASGAGVANMNPSCCNAITALDDACLDYTYAPALPVELLGFSAERDGGGIRLAWATASESGNSHFTVERSGGGGSFEAIAELPGAGSSSATRRYEHLDASPQPGVSYYRLRQADFDGRQSLSEVVSVNIESGGGAFFISPNPVASGEALQVVFDSEQAGEALVEVFNASGQRVAAESFSLEAGLNFHKMALAGIPPGILAARVVRQGAVEAVKFVKN